MVEVSTVVEVSITVENPSALGFWEKRTWAGSDLQI
jgi:hypothetical protein